MHSHEQEKLFGDQILVLLRVELAGNEVFQIRVHLRVAFALRCNRTVEHVLGITHTVLGRLVLAAERGRILEIHRTSLIFRVPDRARIRRVAVRRQASVGFHLRLGTVRSFTRPTRHVLVAPQRAVLQIFLVPGRRVRVRAIEQRIVIELLRLEILGNACHQGEPAGGQLVHRGRIDVGVGCLG
uniref:Uncharacterized protein n=1 Tax=Anopheles merus TaxID=30066 RepID=A0A182VFE7_ANOME